MKITDDRARDLLRWLDDMAGDHTLLFEEMTLHRDAAALIRQLQDAEQEAWQAGLDAGREQGRAAGASSSQEAPTMTADVELLPLPEKVEIDKHLPTGVGIYAYDADTLRDYARANVAHHVEALRVEVEAQRTRADAMAGEAVKHQARAELLAEALRLIAAPQRPDGTWNRDREACRQTAEDALPRDQEEGNG